MRGSVHLNSTSHWQPKGCTIKYKRQSSLSEGHKRVAIGVIFGKKMAQKASQIYFKIRTNIFRTSLRMCPGSEEEVYELQRTMHHLHTAPPSLTALHIYNYFLKARQ